MYLKQPNKIYFTYMDENKQKEAGIGPFFLLKQTNKSNLHNEVLTDFTNP